VSATSARDAESFTGIEPDTQGERSKGCRLTTMEFLVEIEVKLPTDLPEVRRTTLLEAERARGTALAEAGILRAIWRVPGRFANRGIWEAPDATALHDALVSLPLWPYMQVTVIPLAKHPLAGFCLGLSGIGSAAEPSGDH
jgi:muconolactone D-isomerase